MVALAIIAFAAGFGVGLVACVTFWLWCFFRSAVDPP